MDVDVKIKEKCIWKLLNHVMEPSVYTDVREVAREYRLEDHEDKFIVSYTTCLPLHVIWLLTHTNKYNCRNRMW